MSVISKPKKQIILVLSNAPRHGYEIAKSANLPMGSVYDHLAELVKEGFIEYKENERRKVYKLTKKGMILLKILK